MFVIKLARESMLKKLLEIADNICKNHMKKPTENQADKQRYLDMAEAIDRPAYTKVLKWMGETGASLGETLLDSGDKILDFFSF